MNDELRITSDEYHNGYLHSSFVIRHSSFLILLATLALLASCSSLQVPLQPPTFKEREYVRGGNSGLNLAVKPIEGIKAYWELFDDNLPEIGIAAVWVTAKNTSGQTIDLTRSKWTVHIGDRKMARLENAAVLNRYYKGRQIRMYTVEADQRARRDLERMTFHPGRLQPAMGAEGLIFFRIDPSPAAQWTRGAILQINHVRIDNGKWIELNLPLTYASP
jgi:hypothetical protein